jgi:hypothetical protein
MAALIIALILNLFVGTTSDNQINQDQSTSDTETITTMGGTGTWTNTDK